MEPWVSLKRCVFSSGLFGHPSLTAYEMPNVHRETTGQSYRSFDLITLLPIVREHRSVIHVRLRWE